MANDKAMLTVLNSYLIQHKRLSIPGLGTIYVENVPARTDFINKRILPPTYHYRFDKYFDAPDKEFFAYLALQHQVADYEAIKWYNEWAYELRNRIRNEDAVAWEGVGVLKKDISGEIAFEAAGAIPDYLDDAPAERVIRQDARHKMLVGDRETTSTEMTEVLATESHVERTNWWIYALIIAAVLLGILFFYFYHNGFTTASLGNQQGVSLN